MTDLSTLEPKVKLPKTKQTEKKTTQSKSILQHLLANKISDYNMSKVIRNVKVVFQRKNTNSNQVVVNFNT